MVLVCSTSRCLGEGDGAVEHVLVVGSRNRMKPAPVLVFLAVLAQIDIGVHSPNTEPGRTVCLSESVQDPLVACEGLKPAGHLWMNRPADSFCMDFV